MVKKLLFRKKNKGEEISLAPLTTKSKCTLRQGLRADPTELETSKVSDEHLPSTDGAETTTVGISGLTATDTVISREMTDSKDLHREILFIHSALIWFDSIIIRCDGKGALGYIKILIVDESIHWQEDKDDPVKLKSKLHENKLFRFPLFVSESNVIII